MMEKAIKRALSLLIAIIIIGSTLIAAPLVHAAQFTITADVSDSQVFLNWSSAGNIAVYKVYESFDNGTATLLSTIDVNSNPNYLSYTCNGYIPASRHIFYVEAYSQASDPEPFAKTSMISAITYNLMKPTISNVVFNVNGIAQSGTNLHQITVSWKSNTTHTNCGAIIKRNGWTTAEEIVLTSQQVTQATSNGITTCTFIDKFPTYGTPVQYSVAIDKVLTNGTTIYSDFTSYSQIIPIQLPYINTSIVSGAVALTWNYYPNIGYFNLERSKYINSSWGPWDIVNTSLTGAYSGVTDMPSTPGVYRYRLNAKGNYSGSSMSDSIRKTIAPDKVQAVLSQKNQVDLSWVNAVGNISPVRIERRAHGNVYSTIAILASDSQNYNDSESIIDGLTYYYRVSAYESDANFTSAPELRVDTGIPAAPTELTLTVQINEGAILKWRDNATNEQNYRIEKKINNGNFTEVTTQPDMLLQTKEYITFNDTSIIEGNSYTYRVRAYNVYGYSAYTIELASTVTLVQPPAELSAIGGSDSRVDLSWSIPLSTLGTIIERKKGYDGQWGEIARTMASITKYSDFGLQPDTQYFYRIKSVNNLNVISQTHPLGLEGVEARTMLPTVTLFAYPTTLNSILLTWSSVGEGREYVIERKIPGGSYVSITSVTGIFYTDLGLMPNATYIYRIKVRTATNESVYSNEVTLANSYIDPPNNLTVANKSNSTYVLSWMENILTETGFEIWRNTIGTQDWILVNTVGQNKKTYTDEEVQKGLNYNYKVRAFDSSNNIFSSFSNVFSTSEVLNISSPTSLIYSINNYGQVVLAWADAATNETAYIVERKIGSEGEWLVIDNLAPNSSRYTDTRLSSSEVYYYRVKATNSQLALEAYSNELEVSTAMPAEPLNIKVSALSSYKVKITWSQNNEGSSDVYYAVKRKKSTDVSYITAGEVKKDQTIFIDKDLLPGTSYYYIVEARNRAGSVQSINVQVKTKNRIVFSDIPATDSNTWARIPIEDLASRGIITAKDKTKFNPAGNVTRVEFTAYLMRAFKLDMTPVGAFKDVKVGSTYYREIMTAKQLGIINGDSKGYFKPNSNITRQDASVMLCSTLKAYGKPLKSFNSSKLESYRDKNLVAPYAISSIASVFGEGVLVAKSGNAIGTKDYTTRLEAAIMIYRTIDR